MQIFILFDIKCRKLLFSSQFIFFYFSNVKMVNMHFVYNSEFLSLATLFIIIYEITSIIIILININNN